MRIKSWFYLLLSTWLVCVALVPSFAEEILFTSQVDETVEEAEPIEWTKGAMNDESEEIIDTLDQSSNTIGNAAEDSIPIDETHFPDDEFRSFVSSNYDTDKDGMLSKDECAVVTNIDVSDKGITSLQGIEYFPCLKILDCYLNRLTRLDVSECVSLTTLWCFNNQLTDLNVSGCSALEYLLCSQNQLTNLEISKCSALTELWCYGNQLKSLDLTNCKELINAVQTGEEILIDGKLTFETENGVVEIDPSTVLVADGEVLYPRTIEPVGEGIAIDEEHFPDTNFRTYIAKNIDTNKDGALSKDECVAVTAIDVHTHNISSLKGIELFPCLDKLSCQFNSLTSLDVSSNTTLTSLNCYHNQLKELNVNGCKALTNLDSFANQLTNLDVGNNTALTRLNCSENQLVNLDVSNNTALTRLNCSENQLTNLDVSKNAELINLDCSQNQLTSLDVRQCSELEWLQCEKNQLANLKTDHISKLKVLVCINNQLANLDVSNCNKMKVLYCSNNPRVHLDINNSKYMLSAVKDGVQFRGDTEATNNWIGFGSYVNSIYIDYGYFLDAYEGFEDPFLIIDSDAKVTAGENILYSGIAPISISEATVTIKDQAYTGKAIKPNPKVTYGSSRLKKGTDYTVSYKNNKAIGTATVTLKGKGNFAGSVKKTFKIVPKTVTLKSLTAKKKKLEVRWKKVSGITGYEIQYSLKKNFASAKKTTAVKGATLRTLSGLKSKKTYYVRIRAYKKVGGKKYYSAWSKTLSKKTK